MWNYPEELSPITSVEHLQLVETVVPDIALKDKQRFQGVSWENNTHHYLKN